jgi:hypothetical protein
MHTFILEDWLSIGGPGSDTMTQEEAHWLDLEPFQDVVFFVECREPATAGPTLTLQTAPAKDESLFTAIAASVTLNASAAPQLVNAVMTSATVPLARYVRWQVAGPAGGWNATFRVLVVANSPGM